MPESVRSVGLVDEHRIKINLKLYIIFVIILIMSPKLTLWEVEEAVKNFNKDEQKQLISDLPKLLQIPVEDINLLRIAETSFEFWNNTDDTIYDSL